MPMKTRAACFAIVSLLWCGVSASAGTLRCQSVNGNLNCAGSNGASCQTVNGRTVCSSGDGAVVQSFGPSDDAASADDTDADDAAPKQRLELRDAHGHTLSFSRDGSQLHLRNDHVTIDRD